MTPKATNFIRSSSAVGASFDLYQNGKKAEDPADKLKPTANFRKASEASMGNRLWTNDNDFELYEDK